MKEGSVSVPNLSDEGLYDFFKSYDDYERVSPKHANILAGFEVIGHLIDKKDVMEQVYQYSKYYFNKYCTNKDVMKVKAEKIERSSKRWRKTINKL